MPVKLYVCTSLLLHLCVAVCMCVCFIMFACMDVCVCVWMLAMGSQDRDTGTDWMKESRE